MVKESCRIESRRTTGTRVGWLSALPTSVAIVIAIVLRRRRRRSGVKAESNDSAADDVASRADGVEEADPRASRSALPINPTRAAPEIEISAIRAEIERIHSLVPPIGARWRWYDVAYRSLRWMLTGWRRRLVPWRLRIMLNNGLNFVMRFSHYAQLKVRSLDDPLHNLIVPMGEEVEQGGIWVVEFFPPSMFSNLHSALQRNGWDKSKQVRAIDDTNAELVTRARRGDGFEWSRIGTVVDPKSRIFVPDARREMLPDEFKLVDLTAVQLGQSVTAVIAFIPLSDTGAKALNEVWHTQHEPTLTWRGLRPPHVEDRKFAAIHAAQRERKRLHDLARTWLGDRCAGFFAATQLGHPVVDISFFANFDPTAGRPALEMMDPLRALGLGGSALHHYVSAHLPGGVLVPGGSINPHEDDLRNCWGFIAAIRKFADSNDRDGYGEKPYSASTLAAMSDDALRGFLLRVAVTRYTAQLRETLSAAIDTAQIKHRDFSPRQVEQLKRELLSTSLDLPLVARDTAVLWEPAWRAFEGVDLRAVPISGSAHPTEAFDVIESFARSCMESFERLIEDDRVYRDVLATASALGASAASDRLGRRALFVSGVSLLVSIITVLTGFDAAAWHLVAEWFATLWKLFIDQLA